MTENVGDSPFLRVGCGCVVLVTHKQGDIEGWRGFVVKYCGVSGSCEFNHEIVFGDRFLGDYMDVAQWLTPAEYLPVMAHVAELYVKGLRFVEFQDAMKAFLR